MVEYILLFVGVVVILIVAVGPTGFFTNKIDESLDLAVSGAECMAVNTCFDPDGCLPVCPNGCCEPGETPATCREDCGCKTNTECDNGRFCDGAETCGSGGICQPGTPRTCDDGRLCTTDSCDSLAGRCQNIAVTCNGGLPCNDATGCQSGVAPVIDDGIDCTIDSYDEASDTIVHTPSDALCDDGIACNGTESCDPAGGCQAGNEVCASCPAPEGGTIPDGGSRVYYQSAAVPFGEACISEVRMCVNETLTGSFAHPSCCVQNGCGSQCGNISDGCGGILDCGICDACLSCPTSTYDVPVPPVHSQTYCRAPAGQTGCFRTTGATYDWIIGAPDAKCVVVGVSMDYKFVTDINCQGPDGAVIANGADRLYYQSATVPPGGSCVSELRHCSCADLSGSYTEPSCAVP